MSDQRCALTQRVAADDVDRTRHEAPRHTRSQNLFLSVRLTTAAYREVLEALAQDRQRAPNTPEAIHAALGRNHPLLAERFTTAYSTSIADHVQAKPAIIFRGARCLRCGTIRSRPADLSRGLCPECRRRPRLSP